MWTFSVHFIIIQLFIPGPTEGTHHHKEHRHRTMDRLKPLGTSVETNSNTESGHGRNGKDNIAIQLMTITRICENIKLCDINTEFVDRIA